jgi:hypothetical protein
LTPVTFVSLRALLRRADGQRRDGLVDDPPRGHVLLLRGDRQLLGLVRLDLDGSA